MDHISLEPLGKAISQLENGLEEYEKNKTNDLLRDGVIQRFEYTYETSWKILKRFLEAMSPSPDTIDQMGFPTLIRTAWESGLLKSGWKAWNKFRDSRNKTSHTYDEKIAKEVYSRIPKFLEEVKHLYAQLSARINNHVTTDQERIIDN